MQADIYALFAGCNFKRIKKAAEEMEEILSIQLESDVFLFVLIFNLEERDDIFFRNIYL
jgi:hypothetical protein